MDYKEKYKNSPEIIEFIDYFLSSAYTNMDIEDEAVFPKDELYERYKLTIDNLVKEGVYKWLKYKLYD